MNHGSIKNVGGLALFSAPFLRKKLSIETKSFEYTTTTWSSPARWTLTDCVHDYRMQERPLSNTIYNAGYDVDRVNLAAGSAHLTKAA